MTVANDYFLKSVSHQDGCKSPGWDLQTDESELATARKLTIRAVCPADGGCGIYTTWQVEVPLDDDRAGWSHMRGPVEDIGYGSRPIRVGEAWLHAGRASYVGEPNYWIVSRSRERPASWADVAGVISRYRTGNGRLSKSRWIAAAAYRPNTFGMVPSVTDEHQTSRAAAVRWVLADHTPDLTAAPHAVVALTPSESS
ncbi:hypothetical protein [Herbidospora sp. RD11066]